MRFCVTGDFRGMCEICGALFVYEVGDVKADVFTLQDLFYLVC